MQCSPLSYHYTGVAPQSCTKPSSTSLQKPFLSHFQAPHTCAMASLAILLLLARFSSSIAVSPNSYISRITEQQIIATVVPAVVPDIDGQSAPPFLTSPSGSYAAYLRRALDNAGGLAGDACYVQIQQASVGGVWESECTPVGGADACDLAFSPVGLELFAGGHSLWDIGVDADDPRTLILDDRGEMKIVSKEGVTVWTTASGEPWTGQQCGAPLPVTSKPSLDSGVLPPPSAAGEKLVTPPSSATLAGAGSTDFSSGTSPPDDTLPDLPAHPPVDAAPEQPLAPPPADASPDLPDLPLPPPPAYTNPDSPDQLPLSPPPPADVSPDQPLYSSPPPAPAITFGPDTPVPPFGVPLASPPTGDSSFPGGVPFSGPSPAGIPNPHEPARPHQLPLGASPPLPGATRVPFGHGQQQPEGQQGVFGKQPQLLNGEGQQLEESSGGWSGGERGRVAACMALFSLMALGFGF